MPFVVLSLKSCRSIFSFAFVCGVCHMDLEVLYNLFFAEVISSHTTALRQATCVSSWPEWNCMVYIRAIHSNNKSNPLSFFFLLLSLICHQEFLTIYISHRLHFLESSNLLTYNFSWSQQFDLSASILMFPVQWEVIDESVLELQLSLFLLYRAIFSSIRFST